MGGSNVLVRLGEGRLNAYLTVGMFMPYASRFRSLTDVRVQERRDRPKVVSTVQAKMGSICRFGSSNAMREVLGQSSERRRKDAGARREESQGERYVVVSSK